MNEAQVVYAPEPALRILTLTQAADRMDVSPSMIRGKVKNDELWREAFWPEGSDLRTSVGNLLELQKKLGLRYAKTA